MKQNGNIIFIILIAIALFGALSFAFTESFSSGSTSRITKQQAKAYAAAIIKYGSDMQQAVSRMQLSNDCSDEQISFERSPFDGSDTDYVNPNAPADFSCHVFHPNGGAMPYMPPVKKWQDPTKSASNDYGSQVFINSCINNVGSSAATGTCNSEGDDTPYLELILITPYIDIETCKAINKALGYPEAPIQDATTLWSNSHKFKGTFNVAAVAVGPNSWTEGSSNRCIEGDVNPVAGTYHYYHALVIR